MQIVAVCVYFFRKPLTSQRELATYKDSNSICFFFAPKSSRVIASRKNEFRCSDLLADS